MTRHVVFPTSPPSMVVETPRRGFVAPTQRLPTFELRPLAVAVRRASQPAASAGAAPVAPPDPCRCHS